MDCVDRAVRLTIEAQPSDAAAAPGGLGTAPTPFEPQPSFSPTPPGRPSVVVVVADEIPRRAAMDDIDAAGVAASGPERRLTLLALRLAVLEKAASGLGALGFIWATVVLLGGFAITLGRVDFWSVTAILLVEGARIFSRSHELEWQHQATWSLSLADAGRSGARLVARSFRFVFHRHGSSSASKSVGSSFRRRRPRTWPWTGWSWSFLSGHVGRAFYWLQLASATACVALSALRLARQDFGDAAEARTNRRSALDIFYGLALAEALLFLAEKAAWEWEVTHGRVLERVAADCGLLLPTNAGAGEGASAPGLLAVRRFFYDAYSRCVEGSIFDGLRMDLVSFAEELLVGGSHDEQRIAAGILVSLVVASDDDARLRRVGASPAVVERLVEMLGWEREAGARKAAALVVSKLAGKKRNALRVAGVPGAVESVASLLHDAADEECHLLGLLIVKKLARDHDNCSRIGAARGLLDKIIDFTAIADSGASSPWSSPAAAGQTTATTSHVVLTPSRAKAVQRALQVIKMLAGATGSTGKQLRREIAEVVFTVSNIRAVLRHAPRGGAGNLRRLAAEVLTRLAMDADARERIGATGGVVALLLDMFLRPEDAADERVEAGEALAMLALESPRNCGRILKAAGATTTTTTTTTTVDRLVDALDDAVVGVGAARILTNLCAYAGGTSAWFPHLRRAATRGASTTLRRVANSTSTTTDSNQEQRLEVSLGLAAQLVRLTAGPDELAHHLARAGVAEAGLVNALVRVLASHACPSIRAPRIRRFAVELAIALLRATSPAAHFAGLMAAAGMEGELRRVAETTSELECFHVFSGSAGVGRHAVGLAALIDTALDLMAAAVAVDDEPHA